jgi:hypothetical protein
VRLVRPARPSCRPPGTVADTVGLVLLAAELLGRQVGGLVWRRLGDHQAQRAEMRAVGAELAAEQEHPNEPRHQQHRWRRPESPWQVARTRPGRTSSTVKAPGVATLTVDEPRPLTGEFSATVDDLRDHNLNLASASSKLLSGRASDLRFLWTVGDRW